MAYAPAGTAPKSRSRTPASRSQTNGRPAPKPKVGPVTGRGSRTTFLAGLGVGLAVGAIAALLLAPKSGAETRRSLRNRGKKVGAKARDAWEDLRIELEATRRALRRKRRDAKVEIEAER